MSMPSQTLTVSEAENSQESGWTLVGGRQRAAKPGGASQEIGNKRGRKRSSSSSDITRTKKGSPLPGESRDFPGKVWRAKPVLGCAMPTPAEAREARRSAAFLASVNPPFRPPTSPPSAAGGYGSDDDVTTVTTPADSIGPRRVMSIKDERSQRKKARSAAQHVGGTALREPLAVVTKEDAAAPVSPTKSDSSRSSHADRPVRDTSSDSVQHRDSGEEPSRELIDNPRSRSMVVKQVSYRVSGMGHVGYFKKLYSETMIPECVGIHYTSGHVDVLLPYGMVESLGAYLVGKVPNEATYQLCQAQCKMISRNIDFPTPSAMEDCIIYAPYLAMCVRAHDRETIARKLTGNLLTRTAQACVLAGSVACAAVAAPITACAASAAGANTAATASSAIGATVLASAAVFAAAWRVRAWFKPDELVAGEKHSVLGNKVSTAPTPPQDPDAKIKRHSSPKPADTTKVDAARVTGIAISGREPTVFAPNQDNLVKALEKRAGAKHPDYNPHERAAFVTWVLHNWISIFGRTFKIRTAESVEEFVREVDAWAEGCNSSRSLKDKYKETARALADRGIYSGSQLDAQDVSRWIVRDGSVKVETNLTEAIKSPRQILASSPEFVVLVAPFIKGLTGVIKKHCGVDKKAVYTPGLDSKSIADAMTSQVWDNMGNLDFKGYDSCQDEFCSNLYIAIEKRYHAPPATLQLERACSKWTIVRSRLGVSAKVPWLMNSGHPGTTVFNTTLNLALLSYVICKAKGCTPASMDAKIFAGGDDNAPFYNGPRVDIVGELSKLGFPVEYTAVTQLHRVEFLGSRLTQTTTGWNLIPAVGRTIGKLAYSVRADSPKKAAMIARGAALSLHAASSGCPPLRVWLDTILRVTSGIQAIKPADEPWKLSAVYTGEATADTWVQLEDIYGWTKEMQALFEAELSEITEVGTVIDSPLARLLVDRDASFDMKDINHPDVLLERPADSEPRSPTMSALSDDLLRDFHESKYDDDEESTERSPGGPAPPHFPAGIDGSPTYSWAVSRRTRNSLAHAANGNLRPGADDDVKTGTHDRCAGAYVNLSGVTRKAEFCFGSTLDTVVAISHSVRLPWDLFMAYVNGKPVHVVTECYPQEGDNIDIRVKGLGGMLPMSLIRKQSEPVAAPPIGPTADESPVICNRPPPFVLVAVPGSDRYTSHSLDAPVIFSALSLETAGVAFSRLGEVLGAYDYVAPGDVIEVHRLTNSRKSVATCVLPPTRSTVFAALSECSEACSPEAVERATDLAAKALSAAQSENPLPRVSVVVPGVRADMQVDAENVGEACDRAWLKAYGRPHSGPAYVTVNGKSARRDLELKDGDTVRIALKLSGGMDKVNYGERMMDAVCNTIGVLNSSRGAILSATDPFHDHDFQMTGWPDDKQGQSNQACFRASYTISAQTSIAGTGAWDCLVTALPFVDEVRLYNVNRVANTMGNSLSYDRTQLTGGRIVGGVTIFQAPAGSDMVLAKVWDNISLPTAFSQDATRVTGYAFEVVNSSNELSTQGTVIAYRQQVPDPNGATSHNYYNTEGNAASGASASAVLMPSWPQNATQAIQLAGSREYPAREGGYVVCTMNSTAPPTNVDQNIQPLIYSQSASDNTLLSTVPTQTLNYSSPMYNFPPTFMTNFNQSGLYFKGLGQDTTLEVNVKIFVEQFPAQTSGLLESMATPSSPYDPAALELVSRLMRGVPPGVPQCENGLGDFFSGLWNKAKDLVAPIAKSVGSILSIIPHPGVKAAGTALSLVGTSVDAISQVVDAPQPVVVAQAPQRDQPLIMAPTMGAVSMRQMRGMSTGSTMPPPTPEAMAAVMPRASRARQERSRRREPPPPPPPSRGRRASASRKSSSRAQSRSQSRSRRSGRR